MTKTAFAIAAHPDDIEFQMAGTLLLLKQAGYEIHYLNVANGSCGTAVRTKEEIIPLRREEGRAAAAGMGAIFHESLTDDFGIYYEPVLLARLAAVMREVAPDILLLQSPQDYMEDHQNTVRLAASAAFTRGMPNFRTEPPREPVEGPVAIYHAQPHGNRDVLNRFVQPGMWVDIATVMDRKTQLLACHQSQKTWLDQSQGMDAYLHTMQAFAREVGQASGRFDYAEGWRKRRHLGYSSEGFAPLEEALRRYLYLPANG